MKILHLHFAFEFPAKNSEFFRFKYLNFPPTFLDSIGVGGGAGGAGGGGSGAGGGGAVGDHAVTLLTKWNTKDRLEMMMMI